MLRRVTVGMRGQPPTSQGLLRLAAVITAIVGFASAIWVYLTAAAPVGNPLGYEPEDSKQYLRDLERYGGKANVLATELTDWFNGLWHGRRLAFTVACITVLIAGALLLASIPLPDDLDGETSNQKRSGGSDAP
jgi:hypothetical protein